MIQKFAGLPAVRTVMTLLVVASVLAGIHPARAQDGQEQSPQNQPQQQPGNQQAGNQQAGSQEATPEESARRVKPRAYEKWNFNVGGGANLTSGATKVYVRGGGATAAAGVARNYSQYFGFRLDFQFNNLPLRNSALDLAGQASGATSQVYSLMLDPIVNLPVTKQWSGYFLIGPSFYHRTGKLDSSNAVPGSPCNGFWDWWGACSAGHIPLNGDFLRSTENSFGVNFGAGIARKITPKIEIYGEGRILHGSHNGITTDVRPITIGVRW